ncbi:myosin class II heavy chain [Verticillium dahliae]
MSWLHDTSLDPADSGVSHFRGSGVPAQLLDRCSLLVERIPITAQGHHFQERALVADDSPLVCAVLAAPSSKTSSHASPSPSPGPSARDGSGSAQLPPHPTPASPALSTASTAADDQDAGSSPVLPPLPAPRLPGRAQDLLRSTPNEIEDEEARFVTASWGSPYSQGDRNHLRGESFSSDPSEDSPLHQLAFQTPFLRPPPQFAPGQVAQSDSFVSAAQVLANRVRRPTRGLTEDWIRQHTAGENSESRHWLSDGEDGSEHSSLSGSRSGEEGPLYKDSLQTPRAKPAAATRIARRTSSHHPRKRSSVETLKPETKNHIIGSPLANMTSPDLDTPSLDAVGDLSVPISSQDTLERPQTPPKTIAKVDAVGPRTPARVTFKEPTLTPRLRKKVPWKGKNILVLLPRDDERGTDGRAPMPLTAAETERMFSSWDELGYDISGFDLEAAQGSLQSEEGYSQSRNTWPADEDLSKERADRYFKVTLPDLNAWKDYVNELQEAKLRALGVSFGDEEPAPAPSMSPAMTASGLSRQPSVQYPPLPFSPPLPTSSASSNPAIPGFPFPSHFMPGGRASAAQSPGVLSSASPAFTPGHASKFNPRQSISIPMGHSPFQPGHHASPSLAGGHSPFTPGHHASPSLAGWPMHHGPGRIDSPSLLHGVLSPVSPYTPDGFHAASPLFHAHQRHQSLQYPMMPHQQLAQQPSARASPRLQEVQEVDEEPINQSPSKTPEPHNTNTNTNNDDLQAEIDDAEYHLEEQMRNELEHDDYSPHNEERAADELVSLPSGSISEDPSYVHSREASMQFQAPMHFATQIGDGPELQHPRPHSRGHSLTKNYFQDEHRDNANHDGSNSFNAWQDMDTQQADDAAEIETNPSNLGTPVQDFHLANILQQHQRNFSTASNPWSEVASVTANAGNQRRLSHASKPSLSKLNVKAPEFKFNPGKEFTPSGQFVFGNTAFQPPAQTQVFHAESEPFVPSVVSPSGHSFGAPSFSSSMNAGVAPFSPGTSTFNFSMSGPKFRPDAIPFTPSGGLSDAFTSPNASGTDTAAAGPKSIFGNINLAEALTSKKSKAIPIVPPASRDPKPTKGNPYEVDEEGRVVNAAGPKRRQEVARDDGDEVPRFAEPTPSPRPAFAQPVASVEQDAVDMRSGDDGDATPGDTTMSSTSVSEQMADSKAITATSPSDGGRDQLNWTPFDFERKNDAQVFNDARPFGQDFFKKGHKKSLSATAQAFVPGGSWQNVVEPESNVEDDEDEQDRDREATIEPPTRQVEAIDAHETVAEAEEKQIEDAREPTPVFEQPLGEKTAHVPVEQQIEQPVLSRGLGASRFASPPPKPKGLKASRFASPPKPAHKEVELPPPQILSPDGRTSNWADDVSEELPPSGPEHEPTFEEIDAIMDHLNQNDPMMGVNKQAAEEPRWAQPSPTRHISIADVTNSSPFHLQPATHSTVDASSPEPRKYHQLPNLAPPIPTTELEDPFVDPPQSAQSFNAPVHRLNGSEDVANSDWDGTFSDDEQEKLGQRVQFFDGRVNDVVGDLLEARLQPLEKTLLAIERHFASQAGTSARRERRSMSAEVQESDADDEDEEPVLRRSMSPRRDRRMDQIRTTILDAFATTQRGVPTSASAGDASSEVVLRALAEMKEQIGQSLPLEPRGAELRSIIEEVVERRLPSVAQPTITTDTESEYKSKIADLEERLRVEKDRADKETTSRREAEERAAELQRNLQAAETRLEVEIMNRSIYDQRSVDLDEKLKQQEAQTEKELQIRRSAEDRLSEVQRLLRISSEEENRLREVVEERDQRIKAIEVSGAKNNMRMSLLEADQNNSNQSRTELIKRTNVLEHDLREARQEALHFKAETDRAAETSRRQLNELDHALEENRQQQRFLDTLGTQLQENERVRESWRSKFLALQEEMTTAAREITEEHSRRTKREQTLIARQEVLDARLQAEARTRERLEAEIERLENGERQGLRAVGECNRLEALLAELRTENHKLEQKAMRHQREFEEARESGASEVQRTRRSLQSEIDEANNQVNYVRRDLEEQISKLQAELDQANVDVESAKAQAEMLVEEVQTTKTTEIEQLKEKHQNEVEDLHTRHAMQLGNTVEEAQKAEQHLLERLSFSASKTEHLQDRVAHLEEKLEIAKEAALAAAKRAKSPVVEQAQPNFAAPVSTGAAAQVTTAPTPAAKSMGLPEKISPQALRESIMVLQEQLQAREQRIEELEQNIEKLDPEAPTKISKRDDEITWLRELLAVRHADLQDIIAALSGEDYNREAVKDAAIRLKANLQMEEQERERALNGGSAINLLQAASPRMAQAVSPFAAAWGNWRKSQQQQQQQQPSYRSISGVMSSPAGPASRNNSTPSRSTSSQMPSSFLGGLLTPPASNLRQTPSPKPGPSQPTAFNNTGRRLTSAELAQRSRKPSVTAKQAQKMPQTSLQGDSTPPRRQSQSQSHPATPPMMQSSSYDSDAHAGDFDDNDFFEED